MCSIPRNASSRSVVVEVNGNGYKTPLEDLVKHPLQDQWTLWYLENDRTKTKWEDMQNRVTSFGTVEDFWSLHGHIVDPSRLGDGNDYSLFKGNIRPMWEDKANKHGGRWVLSFSRQHSRAELDEMWLDTMLYMIGGTSQYANDINGAVVNIRNRGDKISVWTADYQHKNAINGIGLELKKYLGTDAKITYEMLNTSSKAKPLFVL